MAEPSAAAVLAAVGGVVGFRVRSPLVMAQLRTDVLAAVGGIVGSRVRSPLVMAQLRTDVLARALVGC